MNKTAQLDVLHDKWAKCSKCGLHEWRDENVPVIGRGNLNADYLFIFDAPTHEDVELQDGPVRADSNVGALFLRLIETAGIRLDDCYFTTLVGCEPLTFVPKTEEEKADLKSRAPRPDESKVCKQRIEEVIYIVDPKVILICGERSYLSLLSTKSRGSHNTHMKSLDTGFTLETPGRLGPIYYQTYTTHSPEAADRFSDSTADHHPPRSIHRALSTIREYVEFST